MILNKFSSRWNITIEYKLIQLVVQIFWVFQFNLILFYIRENDSQQFFDDISQ